MKTGYARVSTREQVASLATQRAALQAARCERVFEDTISGAHSTRPDPGPCSAPRRPAG